MGPIMPGCRSLQVTRPLPTSGTPQGAAVFNLEDTNHETGRLRDPGEQAEWLREVRAAASARDYGW